MYNINLIDDSYLYTLLELHKEMRALISPEANNYSCVSQIIRELTYKDARAVGLFFNEDLVGFVTGFAQTDTVYFFSGIYIVNGHRTKLLELLNAAEAAIPSNYVSWESVAMSDSGSAMLEKFGASHSRVVYKKEL